MGDTGEIRGRPWAQGEFRILLFLIVTATAASFVLLGRGVFHLTSSVIGLGGDPYQSLWRITALQEAVAQGSLTVAGEPFRNLGPLPWTPLTALFPEPFSYNLIWILQAPLAALTTYLLGRTLKIPPAPTGVASLLVAFAPYRLAQALGHFGAMQLFWIPGVLWSFLRWLQSPTLPRTLLLAFLLIGTAWTEHTLFLTSAIGLTVAGAMSVRRLGHVLSSARARWYVLLLCGLLFGGILFPFWSELQRTATLDSPLNPGTEQRRRFAPTLASLVSLPPFHPARDTSPPYGTARDTVADRVHGLGVTALVLSAVALAARSPKDRRARFLLVALTVTGTLLALAPRIDLGARWYDALPMLSALRAVDRFLALPVVAVPLLAASALSRLPCWGAVLASLLLFVEILPAHSFPVEDAIIPPFYQELARASEGVLLEIPSATDYLVASRAFWASSIHRRPLLGNFAFERVEDAATRGQREKLLQVPILRDLLLQRTADLERRTFFGQIPTDITHAALATENVRWVLLHETINNLPVLRIGATGPIPATREDVDRARSFLRSVGFPEERVSARTFLFRIPPWPPGASAFLAVRGPGWERISRRADGSVVAELRTGAQFDVRVLGGDVRAVSLAFDVGEGSKSGFLRVDNAGGREWPVRPGARVAIPLGTLAEGIHSFTLHLRPMGESTVDVASIIIENPLVTRVR